MSSAGQRATSWANKVGNVFLSTMEETWQGLFAHRATPGPESYATRLWNFWWQEGCDLLSRRIQQSWTQDGRMPTGSGHVETRQSLERWGGTTDDIEQGNVLGWNVAHWCGCTVEQQPPMVKLNCHQGNQDPTSSKWKAGRFAVLRSISKWQRQHQSSLITFPLCGGTWDAIKCRRGRWFGVVRSWSLLSARSIAFWKMEVLCTPWR